VRVFSSCRRRSDNTNPQGLADRPVPPLADLSAPTTRNSAHSSYDSALLAIVGELDGPLAGGKKRKYANHASHALGAPQVDSPHKERALFPSTHTYSQNVRKRPIDAGRRRPDRRCSTVFRCSLFVPRTQTLLENCYRLADRRSIGSNRGEVNERFLRSSFSDPLWNGRGVALVGSRARVRGS